MAALLTELIKALLAVPKVAITCVIVVFLIIGSICIGLGIAAKPISKYRCQSKQNWLRFIIDLILIFKNIEVYKEIQLSNSSKQGDTDKEDDDPPYVSNIIQFLLTKQVKKDGSNGGTPSK